MGPSPSRVAVDFGVEIELIALPREFSWSSTDETKYEYYQQGYDALMSAMERRQLKVRKIEFTPNGGFQKRPKDYNKWYLTHDTSLEGNNRDEAIPMEIVSRKFEIPKKDWMSEVGHFWLAFYEVFELELNNPSCGSHVHIKPSGSEYDMESLRQIAYAVVIYEKHVLKILPPERRGYYYCQPNTKVSPALRHLFRQGRSESSYQALREEICKINTPAELYLFMQGDQDGSRMALWNFQNLLPGKTKTIEFRGISGVHSGQETIHWILFTIGFILLALQEGKLRNGKPWTYLSLEDPRLHQRAQELWWRVNDYNQRHFTKKFLLPDQYTNMVDVESRSRTRVRSNPKSMARSRSRSRSSSRSLQIID